MKYTPVPFLEPILAVRHCQLKLLATTNWNPGFTQLLLLVSYLFLETLMLTRRPGFEDVVGLGAVNDIDYCGRLLLFCW